MLLLNGIRDGLLLWFRCLVWVLGLILPAALLLTFRRVQEWLLPNFLPWEWLDSIDPADALDLLLVIGIFWVTLLPIFIIGCLLRGVLEDVPSFLEEMRTHEGYERQRKRPGEGKAEER